MSLLPLFFLQSGTKIENTFQQMLKIPLFKYFHKMKVLQNSLSTNRCRIPLFKYFHKMKVLQNSLSTNRRAKGGFERFGGEFGVNEWLEGSMLREL